MFWKHEKEQHVNKYSARGASREVCQPPFPNHAHDLNICGNSYVHTICITMLMVKKCFDQYMYVLRTLGSLLIFFTTVTRGGGLKSGMAMCLYLPMGIDSRTFQHQCASTASNSKKQARKLQATLVRNYRSLADGGEVQSYQRS